MTFWLADECAAAWRDGSLGSFESLWELDALPVDEPNRARGGWSQVFRFETAGETYYLKRQSNYLIRTLHHPRGEPTVTHEFRNYRRYQRNGLGTMDIVAHGERQVGGARQALLVSRGLHGWSSLDQILPGWSERDSHDREAMVRACAMVARRLHDARLVHGCLYPKHVFLRPDDGGYATRLIDLEKTRSMLLGVRDRVRDLEAFMRRCAAWSDDERRTFVSVYLQRPPADSQVSRWIERLEGRRRRKTQP